MRQRIICRLGRMVGRMRGMSYRPGPDDVRCGNPACGEWYHKALRSCPMCDAPRPVAPPVRQRRPINAGVTKASWVEVKASPNEINFSGGCNTLFGILLCATGVGALIGVPLLIQAYLEGQRAERGVKRVLQGHCPYCGESVWVQDLLKAVNCPICGEAFMIKSTMFGGTFSRY